MNARTFLILILLFALLPANAAGPLNSGAQKADRTGKNQGRKDAPAPATSVKGMPDTGDADAGNDIVKEVIEDKDIVPDAKLPESVDDGNPAEKSEEPKEPIELNTPEIFKLKEEYKKEKAEIETPVREKLATLMKQNIEEAEQAYEQKKKAGNTKGMAVAKEQKSIFTDCLEQLTKKNEFKVPEKARAELTDKLDLLKKEKESADLEVKDKLLALEEAYLEKFKETVKPQLDEAKLKPSDAEKLIKEKYEKFLKEEIKMPELPEEKTDAEAGTEQQMTEEDKPIIAIKGSGTKWVDLGEWTAEMAGMDVVEIKLTSTKDYKETQFNPIANSDSIIKYKVINPIVEPRVDYAFRLLRIPGRYGVDVIDWPSPRTNMDIIVRTKPVSQAAAPHGFVIQVSLPEKDLAKVFSKKAMDKKSSVAEPETAEPATGITAPAAADKAKSAPMVEISVTSRPGRALVTVDGQIYADKKGAPLMTPATISISGGKHTVKIAKLGYKDKEFAEFNAVKGARIQAELELNQNFKKLSLVANISEWKGSGVTVKTGDKILVASEGFWTCSDKKDKCGPEGYPNDSKFFKFYADAAKDPRLTTIGNYGALLYRIGKGGTPFVCIPGKEVSADGDGEIFFDINEMPGERKNNSGKLELLIGINASEPAPAAK